MSSRESIPAYTGTYSDATCAPILPIPIYGCRHSPACDVSATRDFSIYSIHPLTFTPFDSGLFSDTSQPSTAAVLHALLVCSIRHAATMNGHAEPIAGNTPLASRIRSRREQLHFKGKDSSKSSAVSRLRYQVDSDDVDDSPASAVSANSNGFHDAHLDPETANSTAIMQQRQFTRVPDATELDELEGGMHPMSATSNSSQPLLSGSSESRLNGNHAISSTVSEKEKYKAKQDDPILSGKQLARSEEEPVSTGLTEKDKRAMVLLVALYLLQGIPVGLAFGSIPYLLRSKLSYSQIGIFTLCTYPYSLKLLWSPIVDSIFSPKLGRRKSWIVPIQTIVGMMLWWLSRNINQYIDKVSMNTSDTFR